MNRTDWWIVAAFVLAFTIGVIGYGGVSSSVTLDHPLTQHAAHRVIR